MSERIVLMFAYHFPPENAIGAARPYRFYKYLSRMGYRCHVITAANQGTAPHVDVQFIADPFVSSPRDGLGWQFERAARKLLIPGATGVRWSGLAFRAALNFFSSRPSSEVTTFSTYPPLGTHLAALQLVRQKQLPWIADFRDPLANVPGHTGNRFQQQIHRWLERTIVKNADITILNTDAAAERSKAAYPSCRDRIHLIWNGFDPEDRIHAMSPPPRDYRLVSHVGELYGRRNITPLLESFSRLIGSGRIVAGSLRIRLVGPIESNCVPPPEFLTRATQQGWLEIISMQVPQNEARRFAQDSDGLLLVQPQSAVQVPAKLFEYLRLSRPIIAFVPPNSPTERILQRSGIPYRCVYAGSRPEEMDSAVQNFFHLDQTADRPNIWFEENFNAEKQTRSLELLIRSLHR